MQGAKTAHKMAMFAEALAEGATVKEAALAAGNKASSGDMMFARLRKLMGPQAV